MATDAEGRTRYRRLVAVVWEDRMRQEKRRPEGIKAQQYIGYKVILETVVETRD